MTTKNLLILSLVISAFALSCKDKVEDGPSKQETNQLSVSVQPVFGGEIVYLDSTYFTTEGYGVQFIELKFIVEDVRGPVKQLMDAALFDYRDSGIDLFSAEGKPQDFASLNGNLGVQSSVNHSDPAAFPNESVLNISNIGGMHWGWNPGYIFMKVEAKVDTIPDGTDLFDHTVVFHVGKDENLQTFSFTNVNWQQTGDKSYHFPLKLDLQTFLQNGQQTIDLKTEHATHTAAGQEALSLKVIQNFKAALSEY